MKAVLVREFAPLDQIQVGELPDPEPGPTDVVIDVIASEVNYPDFMIVEGNYQIKPPFPFSPGKGGAGRVAAVGSKVQNVKVGESVLALVEFGSHAEKLRAPADWCIPMPAGLAYEKAAALGLAYQTAWFALKERAAFQPGDVVLVLGAAGGVGVATIQLAKALGAGSVIGAVLGQAAMDAARRAGADHVFDLSGPDVLDVLKDGVGRATNGHGADIVIDPVGGKANAAALRAMAWCGRLVTLGYVSGEIPAIKANYLMIKNISVTGLNWSDYRIRRLPQMVDAQRQLFSLCLAGKIEPYISQVVPLGHFQEAFRTVRDGKAQGKIIIDVAGKLAMATVSGASISSV